MLLWLAIRGLGSSRSFIVLVLSVALGAGFQISNDANLDGFAVNLLDDALAHGAGDVRIRTRDRLRFDDGDREAAALAGLTGSTVAIPLLSYPGAIVGPDRRSRTVAIQGVDAGSARPPYRIVAGDALRSGQGADELDVLIGTALAARLGTKLDDRVELRVILGPRDLLIGESNVLTLHARVRGIVTGTGTGGAYRAVFVDRTVLGKAAGMPGAASLIALHVRDHGEARAVAARIEHSRPELEARAWSDDDPGLASYLEVRHAIGGISYAMVIAAIAIPMWALLYIHVMRRQRELAILAALGFRRGELFAICTLQSVVIGLLGCLIGAALGYGLSRYFAAHPLFAWESLVVRPRLTLSTFVLPSVVLIATSVVAALHPASRAARVEPAAALRRIE